MDPLPTVNRAHYIIQQQEQQTRLKENILPRAEAEGHAMYKHGTKFPPLNKRDGRKMKNDRFCQHCKIKGHTIDQCFKINGYPDWYKDKYGSKIIAQTTVSGLSATRPEQDTPLEIHHETPSTSLINAVYQEVLKALQEKAGSSGCSATTSLTDPLAGPYY